MKENLIYEKTFNFAIEIVKLYKYLSNQKKEFILSKQVLRSGTSIGANINEAIVAQSKKDFLSKMNIALKEAAETQYWIKLLIATNYIDRNHSKTLINECKEINRILRSIVKTIRDNIKNDERNTG
ncbi:four helix bundle protein [Clostridium sp. ATCC 25772]|uniref:Four helix bundle protein n=1 Tax=Clostridium senegalense TaxID=1465809 RepID=A0A6M0H5R0_9CLOT|nr:four helix bundle protein [Clostridium sp. ATCC 25772]NEU05857.1 four helix bundle protein [Clostridium senegalense]